jgi:hypothetical protein
LGLNLKYGILEQLQKRNIAVTKALPSYVSVADREIVNRVKPFSMQTRVRLYALIRAVEYVIAHRIPGDFVECGVWRGGGMMAIALKLLDSGVKDRSLRLYDTYEGMTPPKDVDKQTRGGKSAESLLAEDTSRKSGIWAVAELDDVKQNMISTRYPLNMLDFIVGDVSDTLGTNISESISLLRVDVDWYEPTRACMNCLYPRLEEGGVFISDDYGHWDGAKIAIDNYFAGVERAPLLTPVDNDCVMGQKPRAIAG